MRPRRLAGGWHLSGCCTIADPKTRSIVVYSLPADGPEYVLHGQFTGDETVPSKILKGFEFISQQSKGMPQIRDESFPK